MCVKAVFIIIQCPLEMGMMIMKKKTCFVVLTECDSSCLSSNIFHACVQIINVMFICLPTVKDQARWIIQFIREMEKMYKATGDKHFNVIIVDYNSSDINIEKRLKKAKLPR